MLAYHIWTTLTIRKWVKVRTSSIVPLSCMEHRFILYYDNIQTISHGTRCCSLVALPFHWFPSISRSSTLLVEPCRSVGFLRVPYYQRTGAGGILPFTNKAPIASLTRICSCLNSSLSLLLYIAPSCCARQDCTCKTSRSDEIISHKEERERGLNCAWQSAARSLL